MKTQDIKKFLYGVQKTKDNNAMTLGLNGRKNILNLNILVFVDVSGSIQQAQFKQFMEQLNKIRGLSTVKVVETDTTIVAMYDYFTTDQNKVMRLGGGGGTEFSEAFKLAKEMKPDAIVFMTDGCVSGDIQNPNIPTGWILTHDGQKPYSFGEVIAELPELNY